MATNVMMQPASREVSTDEKAWAMRLDPNDPVEPVPCEILDVIHETEHEWTFRLGCEAPAAPGQFFELSLPRFGEAPISVSGIDDGILDFTVRAVGKVTRELFTKRAGDIVYVRGPYGRGWPMERFQGKHVVVISGGTGFAPVRQLIRHFNEHPEEIKGLWTIQGFRDEAGVMFKDDIAAMRPNPNCHSIFCLDNEERPGFQQGFVTSYVKDIPFKDFGDDYEVVLVGPPPMMKFTGIELVKNGATEEHIWMSFERKMSCAIGKCGNCRIDSTYICLDGPVFNYTEAKYLID